MRGDRRGLVNRRGEGDFGFQDPILKKHADSGLLRLGRLFEGSRHALVSEEEPTEAKRQSSMYLNRTGIVTHRTKAFHCRSASA